MRGSSAGALAAITAVNFVWGIDFIAIEYMMKYVSASVFTLARLLIGTAVLLLLVLIRGRGFHIEKTDMPRIFISGAAGMSVYLTLENIGTGLTSASFSSLIMATVPVFGMIGDRIFFGNRITALKAGCVIASVAGVYLLVSGEPMGINMKGLGCMLCAAVLWAFYITYVKPLYDRYDLLTILTGLFLSGTIVQIPITLFTPSPMADFNLTRTAVTVATALICIIAGEFGYVYAIGKLSVTMVSIFENVLPVTTVLLSFLVFGTMLSGRQLVGAAVILAAVTVLALRENSKADEEKG